MVCFPVRILDNDRLWVGSFDISDLPVNMLFWRTDTDVSIDHEAPPFIPKLTYLFLVAFLASLTVFDR